MFKVISVGQVVAIVAATNQNIAQRAAKLVKVEYEDLDSILTIQVNKIILVKWFFKISFSSILVVKFICVFWKSNVFLFFKALRVSVVKVVCHFTIYKSFY